MAEVTAPNPQPVTWLHPKIWLGISLLALFGYLLSGYSFLLFHTLSELFCVIIAVVVFLLAWNTKEHSQNQFLLILGCGFLGTGLVDITHLLAYQGMQVFPQAGANLAAQLWVAGRMMFVLGFMAAMVYEDRPLPPRLVLGAFLGLTAVLLTAILGLGLFPKSYDPDQGLTGFKIVAEFSFLLLLTGCIWWLRQRRERFDALMHQYLIGALGLTLASELSFASYADVYGLLNLTGHVLKILAFCLVYAGVMRQGLQQPFSLMFWEMSRQKEQLKRHQDELDRMLAQKTQDLEQEKERLHQSNQLMAQNMEAMGHKLEAAERAANAKSNFLEIMSHELRTPLNGVTGLSFLLLDRPLPPGVAEELKMIHQAGQALADILDEVLELARIEGNLHKSDRDNFSLERLLGQINLTFLAAAKSKRLRFVVEKDNLLGVEVNGNASVVKQILSNLVSNGIQFTDQGQVTLRAQTLSKPGGNLWFRFEVADTGIGISESQRKSLLMGLSAHGLGVNLVKKLVHLAGGELGLESTIGSGTRAWVDLPFGPPQAQKRVAKTDFSDKLEPNPDTPAKRILLVDDEDTNQMVIRRMLEKMGYKVQVASGGREALQLFGALTFDLVLMDCLMPGMDGFETTKQLRKMEAQPRQTRTPIVALTALTRKEDQKECETAGMDDFIKKPVIYPEFKRTLERVFAAVPGLG